MAHQPLRIIAPLPIDTYPSWLSFISQLQVSSPPCFLKIASTSYSKQPTEVLATIEFQESGVSLREFIRETNANQENWPASSVLRLTLDVLEQCAAACSHIGSDNISEEMVFLVNTEPKIAPFPFHGYDTSGGIPEMLQNLVGLLREEQGSLARKLGEELVQAAKSLPCPELLQWFQPRFQAFLSDPPLPAAQPETLADGARKECAKCRSMLPLTAPMHAICGSHYLCDDDFAEYRSQYCLYCPRPLTEKRASCAYCEKEYDRNAVDREAGEGGCCSKDCLELNEYKLSEGEIEAEDEAKHFCLQCSSRAWHELILLCKSHGFCSFRCQKAFNLQLPLGPLSFKQSCLKCVTYEANISKKLTSLAPRVQAIAELKGKLTSGEGTPEVALELKIALCELLEMGRRGTEEGSDWPLTLTIDHLASDYYLLKCCVCEKNAGVPRWPAVELALWPEAPFLVMCQWRPHGVCSEECYAALRQGDSCKVCESAKMRFRLKEACGENSHPTLEVVRRIPGPACRHRLEVRETLPYLSCSHEICRTCLSEEVFDSFKSEYECPICYSRSNTEKLAREAFS